MQEILDADKYHKLWWLLGKTWDAMYKDRRKELRQAVGISPREAAVLFCVQVLDSRATPMEISRWLFRERHSVSMLISRMEKKGLVRKVKDLHGRNLVRVEMTEKARQVYNYVAKRTTIHRIMSSLSEEECHQLSSCLEKLRSRALEDLGMDRKPPWP